MCFYELNAKGNDDGGMIFTEKRVGDGKWKPARNKSPSKRRRRAKIRSSGGEPRRSKRHVEVDKQDETRDAS